MGKCKFVVVNCPSDCPPEKKLCKKKLCKRNVATLERALANFNAGNIPGVLGELSEAVVTTYQASTGTGIPYAGTYVGRNGFVQFATALGSVYLNQPITIQSVFTSKDCNQVAVLANPTNPIQFRCSPAVPFVPQAGIAAPLVIIASFDKCGLITSVQLINAANDVAALFFSACP